ncbi:uncharacterized protein AMSG_09963 [Thecamonas trahens ATCC 50062]|uniref:Uncharacterized protein n=1 Tax=Thecamonas trahens ATCC 50062 TaxID=461836 RepID=A0A0L0DPF1_THETB|nr:hypothetical protein AMSG_09963 [Thecamonas trahens ATCC 50062]KNC54177.1 hypothetical protein AMSG_09963 [Thecamonas trahens ATCC 50062]|eukprot:XP_013753993.1 hypothetical protein AMSG_09963 [Thecamonas trahens ATCC 50062]
MAAAASSSYGAGLKFTWLAGMGQVPVVQLQLKATFLSSEGPMVEAGLGQFTTATVKWRPSETTAGNFDIEYGDVVVLDANSGEPLSNPLAEYTLKWEVEADGKFVRCTNIDSVVDFTSQLAVSQQVTGVEDADEQVFLEEYMDSMRVDAMSHIEAEVRELWSNLAEAWTSLIRGGTASVEHIDHCGVPCARIGRTVEVDTRDVVQTVTTKLATALDIIASSSEEVGDPMSIQVLVSSLIDVGDVTWDETKDAVVETDTLRPHVTSHVKEVFVPFKVFGTSNFELSVEHTRIFLLWPDIDQICTPEYFESKYAEFFTLCNAKYVAYLEKYPAIPRLLESRINDAFDLLDTDANGRIGQDELAAGARVFRHFIVDQASKNITERSQHLDVSVLLDMPVDGELSKLGGKAFRKRWQKRCFVLDREKSTLSYYAAPSDVKPKGAMDLRDYKSAVINEDPPKGEIFCLSMIPRENSDAKQYELAAASDLLRDRWVHLINRAIEQADHVEERAEMAASLVDAVTRLACGVIQQATSARYKKKLGK